MPTIFKYTSFLIANQTKSRMEQNGIGMHTPTEINHMTEQDIRTVSTVLGSKKFLGGDVPCEEDCSVFGVLAQVLWAAPGSSFERLINGEFTYKINMYTCKCIMFNLLKNNTTAI